MAKYSYEAKDTNGKIVKGILEADDQSVVITRLHGLGFYPLKVEKQTVKKGFSFSLLGKKRIPKKQILFFTRQLGDLIEAGIPLVKSLEIITQQATNNELHDTLYDIKMFIEEGGTLHDALSKHPRDFSRLYCGLVKAGETGGFLPEVLSRLADLLEQEDELKSQILSSLAYPTIMILVGLTVVVVLVTYVIPNFQRVFVDLNQDLPYLTQFVLGMSAFMRNNIHFILLALAGIVFFIKQLLSRKTILLSLHHYLLVIPVISTLILKKELSQFCRTLYALLKNGITILPSLEIVRGTIENKALSQEIDKVPVMISKGKHLAESLRECRYFPVIMINMLAVAEESSHLEDVLLKLANSYEKEVQRYLKVLTSLIDPAIIIFMAVIVGFIVAAMILPLFSLNVGM